MRSIRALAYKITFMCLGQISLGLSWRLQIPVVDDVDEGELAMFAIIIFTLCW